MEETLPVLYLRGLSTGDFEPALKGLLGEEASGLSAANINRLVRVWEAEWEAWRRRSLEDVDYVYVWGRWDPRERAPGRAGPWSCPS